jgi:hypothetical protein
LRPNDFSCFSGQKQVIQYNKDIGPPVYGPRNDCIDYSLKEDTSPIPDTARIQSIIDEVFTPKKTVYELYKMTAYEQMKVIKYNISIIMTANNLIRL